MAGSLADRARQHREWNRIRSAEPTNHKAAKSVLQRFSEVADAASERVIDAAMGIRLVEFLTPAGYVTASATQALELASKPQQVWEAIDQGGARIYLKEPNLDAARQILDRVMGRAPNATERLVLGRLEQAEQDRLFLAEVLREYVDPTAYPHIRARLEVIAGRGDQDEGREADD